MITKFYVRHKGSHYWVGSIPEPPEVAVPQLRAKLQGLNLPEVPESWHPSDGLPHFRPNWWRCGTREGAV